ncbi:hypothetical protein BU23DRAFT_170023 [Bimuria novae-zelandiae CBS 107.79]|uniref:Uncharacterized protein n=1 Tax=Bimuria novae-zelandiae CBS 107.79 TaxID=1447943 RepID=A0A6A5V4R6_9PLEO|nr:hypothetical protein BU23DRAFT_170023 [Bimuria novae-zelandiae CBS 107.79]
MRAFAGVHFPTCWPFNCLCCLLPALASSIFNRQLSLVFPAWISLSAAHASALVNLDGAPLALATSNFVWALQHFFVSTYVPARKISWNTTGVFRRFIDIRWRGPGCCRTVDAKLLQCTFGPAADPDALTPSNLLAPCAVCRCIWKHRLQYHEEAKHKSTLLASIAWQHKYLDVPLSVQRFTKSSCLGVSNLGLSCGGFQGPYTTDPCPKAIPGLDRWHLNQCPHAENTDLAKRMQRRH